MIGVAIQRWAAWSPGRSDSQAWKAWAAEPQPLVEEGAPDARFLPAMLRRRCSPLARVMLTAAFECCGESDRAEAPTVFASRHGNINESVVLFERLARREPLSPTRFSHTVHNAQAGLFSIAAGNRRGSSSIAAREDSFACGFLEALAFLQRTPERPVLLVVGDVPLSPTFAPLVEEARCTYAVALLLSRGAGPELRFERVAERREAGRLPWPDAVEFLRWYLSGEQRLVLSGPGGGWAWQRELPAGD
ncbi:MAG: beta-ketoacyl synthase chain length factor [Myxococcota bacterium]|nr:beta-ketoacyl synthase chain length factor [Myxococcota bacterium]